LDEFAKADSVVHSANVKAAATAVITRIVAHIAEKGDTPKILSEIGKAQLQAMQ